MLRDDEFTHVKVLRKMTTKMECTPKAIYSKLLIICKMAEKGYKSPHKWLKKLLFTTGSIPTMP